VKDALTFTAGPHCLQCIRCITYRAVPLSVCPSVTFRCLVETNEATIMQFSLSDSKIILVSGEVKMSANLQGITPSEGVEVRPSTVASENLTNNEP